MQDLILILILLGLAAWAICAIIRKKKSGDCCHGSGTCDGGCSCCCSRKKADEAPHKEK